MIREENTVHDDPFDLDTRQTGAGEVDAAALTSGGTMYPWSGAAVRLTTQQTLHPWSGAAGQRTSHTMHPWSGAARQATQHGTLPFPTL
ncbi:hypothetical protein [Streptomyces sp. NPDC056948]|uniref:hypothetical protein n=1 Tax=Streptomyces sp. NPDC056948 TaxID=3345975 RepID=UPI00363FCC4D